MCTNFDDRTGEKKVENHRCYFKNDSKQFNDFFMHLFLFASQKVNTFFIFDMEANTKSKKQSLHNTIKSSANTIQKAICDFVLLNNPFS